MDSAEVADVDATESIIIRITKTFTIGLESFKDSEMSSLTITSAKVWEQNLKK